jgi:hypothetical protein
VPRCKRCIYVPDEDEWICELCGFAAPRSLAGVLDRTFRRLRRLEAVEEVEDEVELLEDAGFDRDELGRDPEEDECPD